MALGGYHSTIGRFAENSLWEKFLAYHYTGEDFSADIQPEEATRRAAPGYAPVTASIPVITPNTVPADKPSMHITLDVEAERVAYIYTVALLQYEDRFLFYEYDFLPARKNEKINGIAYPRWERENGVIHLDFTYQITPAAVTDGTTTAFVVMEPEMYGFAPKDTIYSVKGWYIFTNSGRKVSARMYFYNDKEGQMRNIVGYFGSEKSGVAPAEIIPQIGDQFQFIDTWWEFDENGEVVDVLRDGNILTFGKERFTHGITPQYVYPGQYSIGIMVEDMDGSQTFSFAPVTVVE